MNFRKYVFKQFISQILPKIGFLFQEKQELIKLIYFKQCNVRYVCLKSDSHLPKKLGYLLHWKPFKIDEKCLLFHLESSSRSQDI